MTTVHLVHGFNVSDNGRGSTDRLVPYFRKAGFTTRQHDYGWMGLLGARFRDPRIAARIARTVKPGDIGCGHSNGCTILAMAADLGTPFAGLVLINPALEADRVVARQVRWIDVYHNRGDVAVKASEFLDWLPWNLGGGHPWGDMGNKGFVGTDARYRNYDCGETWPPVSGHSAIFQQLASWGPRIAARAAARDVNLNEGHQ